MITEHQEVARYQVEEKLRAAELRALRKEDRATRRAASGPSGPRHELATVLRRLADRLEPQPRHRRTGLSVVR
ncbi:hypothetical protein [Kribbella sp. VKM Ac-2568]|jgi:hypothetical protein|uniref:hypothetical protein n=1 Tax=Kribbella sp. VKM Ac-2568 TaxID=2512219 RepID=UPI00104706C9|nr:hypothetical protein [Kribbella sp. VKM Ac-2568]TCM46082.1 hypothetical protein EV648_106549 [Kribbella sp. VKM Ac-2568]